jgi:hypothetical protein
MFLESNEKTQIVRLSQLDHRFQNILLHNCHEFHLDIIIIRSKEIRHRDDNHEQVFQEKTAYFRAKYVKNQELSFNIMKISSAMQLKIVASHNFR